MGIDRTGSTLRAVQQAAQAPKSAKFPTKRGQKVGKLTEARKNAAKSIRRKSGL
jgi:hypothetical protein